MVKYFKLDVLEKANQLTADHDMHRPVRAKLYVGIGRTSCSSDRGAEAVAFDNKMAIAKMKTVAVKLI